MSPNRRRQRLGALAVLVAIALGLAAPAALAAGPSKPPRTGSGSAQVDKPCDGLPDPIGVVTDGCNAIADAVPDVPSPKEIAELPTKAATDVLNGIKNDIVSTMAAGVAKAASWLLGKTLDAITASTTPDVTAKWFVGRYAQMAGLAALFAIPFLVLAAIQSVAATDWGILARAAFVETPLAFLFTAMAIGVTALLLAITDGMSDWITHHSQADTESLVKSLVHVYADTGTLAVPPFLALVAAITAVAGAFLVWLELIVREAGIYICLAFVPFVMAARIWPRIAHWCRRLVEVGVVIIFSKFAIAAIFAIAAAALGQVGQGKDLRAVFAGAALVLLAAFAPYALLKLIPMAEGTVAAMGGHRQHLQAAPTTGPVPSPAALMQDQIRSRLSGGVSGGGGGQASGGAGAAGAEGVAGAEAAGGAAGAAGAAGPGGLTILGAQAVKETATAGPKAAAGLGEHTDQLAGASGANGSQLDSYGGQAAAAAGGAPGARPSQDASPGAAATDAASPGSADAGFPAAGQGPEPPTPSVPSVPPTAGPSATRPTPVDVDPGPTPDVHDPTPHTGPPTPPPSNRIDE